MGWLFLFVLVSLFTIVSIILLVYGVITKQKIVLKTVLFFWLGIFAFYLIATVLHTINSKVVLEKEDFYGLYVVDRTYFPGKQADWQYNNFRFEIKENDSIYFYVTDGLEINKTYKGKISTRAPFSSARLVIHMENPKHHILNTNPTIYRESWSFMMVFNSPKFHNVYFKKGKWKDIE
ncbi:MAG: hypothetical protein ABF274_04775 [Nonlabens sp.]|uniref:hypothetical protein n=1 Tax=Nonlabens sp. TaxID=1888209 RepID=UPI00321A5C96